MKAKTIKAILAKKFKSLVDTIEDEAVRKLVENNTIITGGCIASMLLGEKINDFDLYFTDHATTKAVAEYYVKRFEVKNRHGIPCAVTVDDRDNRVRIVVKSAGIASADGATSEYEYFESSPEDRAAGYVGEVMSDVGEIEEAYQETEQLALQTEGAVYRPVFMSTNAITLSDKVQIVLRFYGAADAIHENYDFVHCTNYWTSKDGNLTLRQPALESLLCKELRYVGSKYPVCSVIRLRKFIRRGWVINAGQILKMMMQVSELDLAEPDVLQDQLTGVDSAYFIELMSKVRENDPEKVNAAYLVEIIDRMF
ncbi:MAG: hypothetical protein IT423_07285 [Pirellulaceae bacterium]|nr:hypothetical protein [Pirellulaceae bacterium]